MDAPTIRREFELPDEDVCELEARCLDWETVLDARNHWLFVHRRRTPSVFNETEVTLAVLIPVGYPTTALDMVFVHPPLTRRDGQPIAATSQRAIAGVDFQQWSRHRTGENPWREGVDNVCTQLDLADEWFLREAVR